MLKYSAFASVGLLLIQACSGAMGGSTGPTSTPVAGGHSTTIVASGASSGGGGGGGGYDVIGALTTYTFSPTPDTVAVGAHVTFQFQNVTHWVTFDQNPGAVANIPPTSNADSTRSFVTPGTYTYHCAIHSYMHGTVVVQ
jgi:plastocyanin